MSETNNKSQKTSIIKSASSVLQKPKFGLIHRAIQDIDRLINVDTIPIPLGIEGKDGQMVIIFEKGTIIPCEAFLPIELNQGIDGKFDLKIFQGFSILVKDNVRLVEFEVLNYSTPARLWLVYLKLSIDGEGKLEVEILDRQTEKFYKLHITHYTGLSENEIKELEKQHMYHEYQIYMRIIKE